MRTQQRYSNHQIFRSKLVRVIILDWDVRFCSVIDTSPRTVIFLQGLINLRPQEYKLPVSLSSSAVCTLSQWQGVSIYLSWFWDKRVMRKNPGVTRAERKRSPHSAHQKQRSMKWEGNVWNPQTWQRTEEGDNLFFFSSLNWISIFLAGLKLSVRSLPSTLT